MSRSKENVDVQYEVALALNKFMGEGSSLLSAQKSQTKALEMIEELGVDVDNLSAVLKAFEFAGEKELLANVDGLTGLFNKRYFSEQLDRYWHRWLGERQVPDNFGLVMLDVGKFKDVNDNFDHMTGDQVLQLIAQAIKKLFRPGDVVARWGGDEFAVIVSGLSGEMDVADLEWRVNFELDKLLQEVEGLDRVRKGWVGRGEELERGEAKVYCRLDLGMIRVSEVEEKIQQIKDLINLVDDMMYQKKSRKKKIA